MFKWVQKELFFFATLAFVFVAAASVSRFLKTHLHQETTLISTARVVWPDNQAAVYPQKPPASFFLAQKEKTQKKATDPVSPSANAVIPMAHSTIQNVVTNVHPKPKASRRRPVYRKASRSNQSNARAYRVSQAPKPIIKHVKRTQQAGASASPSKASHASKPDTLALRAYEVHMKWVKKTLAEYQSDSPQKASP